jgi:hypothetical protein
MGRGGGRFSPSGECDEDTLKYVSLYSPFLKPVLICSLVGLQFLWNSCCSLSIAETAVSSAKCFVVDSGKVCRSSVYSRYNNGPRTLPPDKSVLIMESSVHSVSVGVSRSWLSASSPSGSFSEECGRSTSAQYLAKACPFSTLFLAKFPYNVLSNVEDFPPIFNFLVAFHVK